MATPLIPVKTPDGQAELAERRRRLSQRHRTVLLLVDGRRTETEVRALARQAGAGETCFGELVGMGLIALPEPSAPAMPHVAPIDPWQVDIPIDAVDPAAATRAAVEEPESVLPAARSLHPESGGLESGPGAMLTDSVMQDLDAIADAADPELEEARSILMRSLRSEAPLAGSITLLRVRRARTRSELAQLIDEVEQRIVKPYRSLAAQQTMRRVRQLLVPRVGSTMPSS